MRIIARRTLTEFARSLIGHKDHHAVKSALDAWFSEAQSAEWNNSAEVKQHYATASIISADRIVFNIKGNSCRLITSIDYNRKIVWIIWLGTHADYDKINAKEVRYARSP